MTARLGRAFARVVTVAVVRWPRVWPLFRAPIAWMFGRIAATWDRDRAPDAYAPLEVALANVDGAIRTVLDIGTGTGEAAVLAARRFPGAAVHAVDVAPAMIAHARRKAADAPVTFEVADASRLPYADGTFDLVTAGNMIPFFDELARIVAPRGYAVFSFSAGRETPIYVPPERLRREFEARGFTEFAQFAAARGTAFLARKE